ncbi:helix-turn-helix transcriptional regulator [Pluralibacter sp.]|uniref:helix-turn-helix domain-containing protein n=1 Tax=Pluralibacter sp. TaxID=1920032 RepID=UPI0025EFAD83|nr:helix-turn-helix transcriptional regulator [Pluralibacter sp.]MBV8043236.1 helix-turn-helix transcriptional regulator [Pluralibacter sp.]
MPKKIKLYTHEEVEVRTLNTPESIRAYEEAGEEFALLEQLTEWRENAGLTRAEVAARMGVSAPAISRLERNIDRATWTTLKRYASACGVKIAITVHTPDNP